MFFDFGISGDGLPPKTLCLTFDDGPGETAGEGPGPRTSEIGTYLYERGIPATFFVVGKFIGGLEHVLGQLRDQGHLIANHTFDHPDLLRDSPNADWLVDQILLTDARIAEYVNRPQVFFRPPFGSWRSEGKTTSTLAHVLNRRGQLCRYIGPILWDVDGGDWTYWRDRRPPADCTRNYLDQIEKVGQGIVLMHDSSADAAAIRGRNQTMQLTIELVPLLIERGYGFVRLENVPEVASACAVSYQIAMQADCGLFVSVRQINGWEVWVDRPWVGGRERFGVVVLGASKIALRAANGRFLSANQSSGEAALADSLVIGEREAFDVEHRGKDLAALRTTSGTYLGCDTRLGGRLTTVLKSRNTHSVFKMVKISGKDAG